MSLNLLSETMYNIQNKMTFIAGACTCSSGFKNFNVGTKNTCLLLLQAGDKGPNDILTRIYKSHSYCKARNSELPLPTNAIENENYRLAMISLGGIKAAALDLNDINQEGKYVKFSNGKSPSWFSWKPGEPNNSYGKEDYIALLLDPSPENWNDYNKNERVSIICEKKCL